MLIITDVVTDKDSWDWELPLVFEQRQKSRLRLTHDGRDLGLMLPRGTRLTDGQLLLADNGNVICVRAKPEPLAKASTEDPHLLLRAAYHLGNRHTPLEIKADSVCFARDHVLEQMLMGMGLAIEHIIATFEPEYGAYHQHH